MSKISRVPLRTVGAVAVFALVATSFGTRLAHAESADTSSAPDSSAKSPDGGPAAEAPAAPPAAEPEVPANGATAAAPAPSTSTAPAAVPPPPAASPPPSPPPVPPATPTPSVAPPPPAATVIQSAPPPAAPSTAENAWYDGGFLGGPPVGTRIYGMTVAEFGLTRNFVSVGGARGATGVHYSERGGYLAQVIGMMLVFAGAQAQADSSHSTVTVGLGDGEHQLGSGFALEMDGYSRSLGGDGKGFAARVVWGFPIGDHLPWILDLGVCSAFMTYDWTTAGVGTNGAPVQQPEHVTKGGIIGFAVGLMMPLGAWAQIDGKVNYYLGGDREAEASLIGNLTNRFYAGGGAVYWFGNAGAQLVGGVRL